MSTLELENVSLDSFSTVASFADATITLTMSGNADLRARDPMGKLLVGLHDEALRLGVSEACVEMMQLEFMNSSCFKVFVSWLRKVQQLDADKQYKIRFRSNPEMLWQRRSLHALQAFAVGLVTVEG